MQLAQRLAVAAQQLGGRRTDHLGSCVRQAGRLGVAAHQLWRQVSAHCTVTPGLCMHSLGAAMLDLGGGVLVSSGAFLASLSPVLYGFSMCLFKIC
jgi:hypothetical protein